MKKSIRNFVLVSSVAILSAGSLHAAVSGGAPTPKTPPPSTSLVMTAILAVFGY
jgi:hypothetical protein